MSTWAAEITVTVLDSAAGHERLIAFLKSHGCADVYTAWPASLLVADGSEGGEDVEPLLLNQNCHLSAFFEDSSLFLFD